MKTTGHTDKAIRAMAIYQKIVVGFILLYLVAIVGSLLVPDDLRPALQYLMIPLMLIASVFFFLLVIRVFGLPIGLIVVAADIVLIGSSVYPELPSMFERTPRARLSDMGTEEEFNELVKELEKAALVTPVWPDDPNLPKKIDAAREELARKRREQFAGAFDAPPPPPGFRGPPLIWVVLANIALLIIVSLRATAILRQHGISTGLLGPELADFVRKDASPPAAPGSKAG